MKKFIHIICIMILAGCSKAQPPKTPAYQPVIPGDSDINTTLMKPHRVTYKKLGGEMTYEMRSVTKNGHAAYELAIYFNQSKTPDLIYINQATLGYLGRRLELKDYTIDVQFENSRFSGKLIPVEGSDYNEIIYDKNYPHNAFEPAVINYFIAALPLSKGYTASIPVFDLNNGSEMFWSNIKVEGKETIKVNGKKYDTWKVVSNGIREKTVWVSTEVPYAIKMKTKGNRGTWELSEF